MKKRTQRLTLVGPSDSTSSPFEEDVAADFKADKLMRDYLCPAPEQLEEGAGFARIYRFPTRPDNNPGNTV